MSLTFSLPVVAFNIPGLCDVVVDGETGLLVERENPAALAETIKKLAADADLRARLGRSGKQRAIALYSIDSNIAAHEKLYEQIVS